MSAERAASTPSPVADVNTASGNLGASQRVRQLQEQCTAMKKNARRISACRVCSAPGATLSSTIPARGQHLSSLSAVAWSMRGGLYKKSLFSS